jgi:alpha-glucosidase
MPPREQHFRFNSHHQPPAWVQDQVFYQIFPDRFCNGDPSLSVKHHEYEYRGKAVISKAWGEPVSRHEEGTAPGILRRGSGGHRRQAALPAIPGVTALYLNPIFDSPSNHKYDTQDYFKVDAHLGTNAQFAELTRNLHQRGMRIILDAVVNHTSTEHPWFCPPLGAQSNPDSLAQLLHLRSGRGLCQLEGIRSLPKLDFSSEQVQDAVYRADNAILRYWMRAPTRSMAGASTSSTCWGSGALPRATAAMCAPFAAR